MSIRDTVPWSHSFLSRARRSHMDVAKYLVRCGADAHHATAEGNTLLHLAAWYGSADAVDWLVRGSTHGPGSKTLDLSQAAISCAPEGSGVCSQVAASPSSNTVERCNSQPACRLCHTLMPCVLRFAAARLLLITLLLTKHAVFP